MGDKFQDQWYHRIELFGEEDSQEAYIYTQSEYLWEQWRYIQEHVVKSLIECLNYEMLPRHADVEWMRNGGGFGCVTKIGRRWKETIDSMTILED